MSYATKASVQRAAREFNEHRDYMVRTWGSVTCTERYDPQFVKAKNDLRTLHARHTVEVEALACRM